MTTGLCQCGCGGKTEISLISDATRNYVRGEPRPLIVGHRRPPSVESVLETFHANYVVAESGCWEWTRALTTTGYASFKRVMGPRKSDRFHYGHRWAYTFLVGPIPEGFEVDHLCRNRKCVNPEHLEAVTPGENTRRAHVEDYCLRGHARTSDNVGKAGQCLSCQRQLWHERRKHKRRPKVRAA